MVLDGVQLKQATVPMLLGELLQRKDDNGNLSFMWNEYANVRSQNIPELFHDAGQCYFFNLTKFKEGNSRIGYEIPRIYCQDIDTPEDFDFAEKLFQIVMYDRFK